MDQFLATNPTNERADQAKLLKAEALYKQQSYTDAASMYGELRASELSPRLRAEAAYKLGLCHVQTKNIPGVIEAFTYYLQTFPDTPQIPAALAQRALAYEQSKNYPAALTDLNIILAKYPKAHEREAALQLKALILGQQDNTKGMVDTFRQLLKEFPKSSVAAQAQYYIGKTAFEAKDYKTALTALNTARQLNKEQVLQSGVRSDHPLPILFERSACAHQRSEQFHGGQSRTPMCRRRFWSGSESSITTRKISRLRKNISARFEKRTTQARLNPITFFISATRLRS